MIPGTYYVPDTYVPGISRLPTRYVCTWYPVSAGRRTFRPWTHTSDDSYMYQLSLVVATATVSYYAVRRIFLVPSIQSHDAGTNHHSRKMTKKNDVLPGTSVAHYQVQASLSLLSLGGTRVNSMAAVEGETPKRWLHRRSC